MTCLMFLKGAEWLLCLTNDSGVMGGKGRSREAGQEAPMAAQARRNGGLNHHFLEAGEVWIGMYFAGRDKTLLGGLERLWGWGVAGRTGRTSRRTLVQEEVVISFPVLPSVDPA